MKTSVDTISPRDVSIVIRSGSPPGAAVTRALTISASRSQRLMSISWTKEFVIDIAPENQSGAAVLRWMLCRRTGAPISPSILIRFISA